VGISLQSRGPSSSEIPKALPPFFLKAEISSLVMIWRIRLGRKPATCLIVSVSEIKISTSFDRNGTLILKVAVAHDCLYCQQLQGVAEIRDPTDNQSYSSSPLLLQHPSYS
jgi:hypothetical protein